MSQRRFNFGVSLTVGRPRAFFGPLDDETTMTGLRLTARIVKTVTKEPNSLDLTVFNLGPLSRRLFTRRPLHVRLDCGYDGKLERIFAGDVYWSESKLNGPTWETHALVRDGLRAYRSARVNRAFAPGVTLRAALNDCARSMGLRLPELEGPELSRQFPLGITLFGPTYQQLSRLLDPVGMEWSVQDGRLQILRRGESRANAPAFLSPQTGLIGSPEFGGPPEEKKPPLLRASCFVRPGLSAGQRVTLESAEHKGTFKLIRLEHEIDNRGRSPRSDLELKAARQ